MKSKASHRLFSDSCRNSEINLINRSWRKRLLRANFRQFQQTVSTSATMPRTRGFQSNQKQLPQFRHSCRLPQLTSLLCTADRLAWCKECLTSIQCRNKDPPNGLSRTSREHPQSHNRINPIFCQRATSAYDVQYLFLAKTNTPLAREKMLLQCCRNAEPSPSLRAPSCRHPQIVNNLSPAVKEVLQLFRVRVFRTSFARQKAPQCGDWKRQTRPVGFQIESPYVRHKTPMSPIIRPPPFLTMYDCGAPPVLPYSGAGDVRALRDRQKPDGGWSSL